VSIGQALVDAGFLSGVSHDPGGQDNGSVAGKTGYMYYPCNNGYFLYAGLEHPTVNDTTLFSQACSSSFSTYLNSNYGMNYAVGHN
jgi:hypothetical protein